MPLITINQVQKYYGDNHVLKGVDLDIDMGQVISIIGRSGSGKSTLLRCINGLEGYQDGSIKLGGMTITDRDSQAREISRSVGMVFQNFNLFPHMTALENVMLAPRRVLKKSADECRELAKQMLEKVGLGDRLDYSPSSLSGGQQQRVAIARALAMSPKVLLCDEITSALDPELVGEVLKVLEQLAAEGMTLILVTHEMNFAREVGDRVVFMHQGRVWEQGDSKTLFANPQTTELKQFISSVRGLNKPKDTKMDIAQFPQLNPPPRLLMGPGPINADPRVLRAMSSQLIGQYDPAMTHYMNEVMALYRGVFRTDNRWTMLVDGTSRAGIEAILISAIRPGDKVLVPVFGRFGHLLCEIARRCRAEVHTIEVPWGEVFTPDQVEDAIKRVRPRMLLTVQGDTSTTMLQPLAELGAICRRYDVLFYTDATASLGGNALETDAWALDAVSAGMQKCLGGPSGTSPITLSARMEEAIRRRKCIEEGIRTDAHHDGVDEMVYSNYFDLGMVMDYWGPERLNHHTEATTALFGARECARLILQEGLDNGIARHKLHGDALLKGIQSMGLETFGDLKHKMNNVLGVVIPQGVNGDQVRKLMLEDFGIEIGTSFGPLHGKVWRIGTMGYNARKDCVMTTLSALESVLNYLRFTTTQGAAMQAAWDHYRSETAL